MNHPNIVAHAVSVRNAPAPFAIRHLSHARLPLQTSAGMVAAGRLGSGPALVLAHGWPWSLFSWHRIIPDLARRFRVHWYDMPG
jgi:pimeloyl-ACP methyl ester carboxylesterase